MGPWSRSFIAAVAGNAERPDLEVTDLRIEPGVISARVDGCEVTLTAAPIPQRIWTAMTRYAKGMGQLEDAVEGRIQSVHLEHLLEEDWGEQLVPRPRAIARSCVCEEVADCEHMAAVAFGVADEVEFSPRTLLRFRGIAEQAAEPGLAGADPWQGRELPAQQSERTTSTYAVLKRLGSSGLPGSGTDDLATALRTAYGVLAPPSTT
jgi:uncharacterized Zn finger protein